MSHNPAVLPAAYADKVGPEAPGEKLPKAAELPQGFRFAAAACGLRRKDRLDLGLIVSERPAAAAAMFTTNLVAAAPVKLSREHVRRSGARMRAIVVNSGNANCSVGPRGMAASVATAKKVAAVLGCRAEQVLVSSTGVIGVPLPVEKILNALPGMAPALGDRPENYAALTRAIMTTDTRPKWAAASCRIGGKKVRIIGCAKGAGMIHPNMATMLAYVLTDGKASPGVLRRVLRSVVGRTFNCITVDGDTSTNDTVALFANGASGAAAIRTGSAGERAFAAALEKVCKALALEIVRDGEGAQRVVEIEVRGAASDRAARVIAETIATSPLVKTALAGADPNWGRILAAAGRAPLRKHERFNPERTEITVAGIRMYRRGVAPEFDERAAHEKMLATSLPIVVDLRGGRGSARMWTCDFTHDYVTINASYRT